MLASANPLFLEAIGWTALTNELGTATPNGEGIDIALIEAKPQGTLNYRADVNHPEFTGVSFFDRTVVNTNSVASSHATEVLQHLLGNVTGVAVGVTNVVMQEAGDWINIDLLRTNVLNKTPTIETADIVNLSWVGSSETSSAVNVSRTLDFVVNRDQIVAVSGLLNNDQAPISPLWGHTYNTIIVGNAENNHSPGLTLFEEPGRSKPDLVGPRMFSSYNVPFVSGAAAVLLEMARGVPAFAQADDPKVIKSILLASADKTFNPSWNNSPTQPLDDRFGAGQLDIYRSYQLMFEGEAVPGTVAPVAWARQMLTSNTVHRYHLVAPEGQNIPRLHASLNWMREVWDAAPQPGIFDPQIALADMSLRLYASSNGVATVLLAQSDSPVDNVEYLYETGLGVDECILEVETSRDVEYALSWWSDLDVTPEITALEFTGGGFLHLTADVVPGYQYAVEAGIPGSGSWTNVVPAQTLTNSPAVLTVPATAATGSLRISQLY